MDHIGFKRLYIAGWRQFQSIEIDLHPRLTIITGANGAGKSTLLSFFTRHFGYNRNFLGTPENRKGTTQFRFGLFEALRRGFGLEKPPPPPNGVKIGELEYNSGVVCTLRLPPGAALQYNVNMENQQSIPGLHIDSHRPPNIYRHVQNFPATPPAVSQIGNSLNHEYMNYFANGQIQHGSLHHIKMTLIQMSIFGHGNETMDPNPELISLFKGFEEKLRILLPKSLGFKRLIIRSPEVILSTNSGDFIVDAASGGVIKLFEIAWQIYFFAQNLGNFVITFDEPENHLHPSMQKYFLPSIMSAFPGAQVVVVTHSPFIITAMQESSVYVLKYVDGEFVDQEVDDDQSIRGLVGSRVVAERLDTVNKAGSASEILRDVLGITTTIPDWAEGRIVEIVNGYKGVHLTEDVIKQLYTDLAREGLASSYPSAISSLTSPQ